MAAYVIVEVNVTDPALYEDYKKLVPVFLSLLRMTALSPHSALPLKKQHSPKHNRNEKRSRVTDIGRSKPWR